MQTVQTAQGVARLGPAFVESSAQPQQWGRSLGPVAGWFKCESPFTGLLGSFYVAQHIL